MTALAQSSPGPIALNAAIQVGWRVGGAVGMVIATIATILPPMIILTVVSIFYSAFANNGYVALVLKGMQAGVAAVIADVVCDLGKQGAQNEIVDPYCPDARSIYRDILFEYQRDLRDSRIGAHRRDSFADRPAEGGKKMRLIDLFLSFLRIGLFSVGGGYAAMPLIQDQVVISHPWLTMSEFYRPDHDRRNDAGPDRRQFRDVCRNAHRRHSRRADRDAVA